MKLLFNLKSFQYSAIVLLVASCLNTIASPAAAHDIVLVPGKDRVTVRYGHPGDWLAIDDEKLLEFKVFGMPASSTDLQDALKRRNLVLLLQQKLVTPSLFAARYDNGLWLKLPTPAGSKERWRNASRFMLAQGSDPMASLKFAKGAALSTSDTAIYKTEVGHLLELIPQKNPATLRAGELLPVLVQFNGKPLAGAGIEVSDLVTVMAEDKIERHKSDAQGIAQVLLKGRGLTVLAVDYQHPNDGSLGASAKALPVDKFLLVSTYAFIR